MIKSGSVIPHIGTIGELLAYGGRRQVLDFELFSKWIKGWRECFC